jgi:predicted permease
VSLLTVWQQLALRVRAHLFPIAASGEMDDELHDHLEREVARNIARGLTPGEARAAARRAFGNLAEAKDAMRDATRWRWLSRLERDLAYAARALRRAPAFSLTVVATIALALGLNGTVFTIFNAYVLRPLPVRDPGRLYDVTLLGNRGPEQWTESWMDWDDYRELERRNPAFSEALAHRMTFVRIGPTPSQGELVSGNYFRMLGVSTVLGRPLLPEDAAVFGQGAVLVLSHRVWQNRFGSDPAIVGSSMVIHGHPFTVIGVASPRFTGLTETAVDFWAPITMIDRLEGNTARREARALPRIGVVGRLLPGLGRTRATALLTVWFAAATADRPPLRRVAAVALESRTSAIPVSPELVLMFAPIAAAFVLIMIIACANVANMMLARGLARQREIGIRLCLGAGRRQVVWQLLTEAALLALPAAAAGYLVSRATIGLGVRWMFATIPPAFSSYLRMVPLTPDVRVFAFMVVSALGAAVLFGLAPALSVTRPGILQATPGEFEAGYRPSRLRSALGVAQIAGCVLLLVVAGVLLQSAARARGIDTGFQTPGLVQIEVNDGMRAPLLAELRELSLVRSIAAATDPPADGRFLPVAVAVPGRAAIEPVFSNRVSPGYFADLGMRIVRGRTFTDLEAGGDLAVVLVSETTADRLFGGGGAAVGRELRLTGDDQDLKSRHLTPFRSARVIGVVSDAIAGCVCTNRASPIAYYPISADSTGTRLLVSVAGAAEPAIATLDTALERRVPGAIEELHSLDAAVAVQVYPFRAASWVSSALGAVALLLTLTGIYGVLSYLVTQRTREIGIRMALGAGAPAVVALVMRESFRMAALGGGIGMILAVGVSRLVASQLEITNTFNPLAYGGSAAIALLACLVAAWVPSRRAARVSPMETLRQE